MAQLKKVRVQLLDPETGALIEDVDIVTSADSVSFTDGETFQQKLDLGKLKGEKGDQGERGAKGDRGETGPQGPKGETGDTGAQGIQGPKGDTWKPFIDSSGNLTWTKDSSSTAPTTSNIKGPKGDRGETGPQGIQGQQGAKGDKGDPGDMIKVGTDLVSATEKKLFFKVIG
ncbi:hypothetical protein ABFP60_00025 [Clostridioides difficile]